MAVTKKTFSWYFIATNVGTLYVHSSASIVGNHNTRTPKRNPRNSEFSWYWFQDAWTKTKDDDMKRLIWLEFPVFCNKICMTLRAGLLTNINAIEKSYKWYKGIYR